MTSLKSESAPIESQRVLMNERSCMFLPLACLASDRTRFRQPAHASLTPQAATLAAARIALCAPAADVRTEHVVAVRISLA